MYTTNSTQTLQSRSRLANRDYWERGTFKYDCLHDRLLCVLEQLRAVEPASVLDIGCGTGELARAMGEQIPRTVYFGCDISQSAVDRLASDRVVRCDLNAGELAFVGHAFDCVVASGICEYVDDLHALLTDIHQRLAEGGTLIVSYVNRRHVARLVRRLLGRSPGGNRTWRPLVRLSEFERLLAGAGFTIARRVVTSGRIENAGRRPWPKWQAAYRDALGRCAPLRLLLARQMIFVCRKTEC